MHDDVRSRPLTFPSIPLGERETPHDLRRLLHKGSASLRADRAAQALQEGLLGEVLPERLELVQQLHEYIAGALAAGGSAATARKQIRDLTQLFAWAEKVGAELSITHIEKTYLDWAEHLLHRVRVVKDLRLTSATGYIRLTGAALDGVLGRRTPLSELTRIRGPRGRKTAQGAQAEKQNLQATFALGHLLQCICDGLSLQVIWGPRRFSIPLQGGGELKIARGSRHRPDSERALHNVRASAALDVAYEKDRSLDHGLRKDLVNLRIQAELLVFIGQTGMNLAQAQGLPLRRFSYSSDIDGYKVREYKPRRQGEVLFEIFTEYRSHFERYLTWRRELFPNADKLFPLIRHLGARAERRPSFSTIQAACKQIGIFWVPPGVLRATRVNWLLRRSGDPDLTAEMSSHHRKTLLRSYEVPSQQRAIAEITRFWQSNDPTLVGPTPSLAVAPGECDGTPLALPDKPEAAPAPDCRRPSGCLWCEHHRDIDSFEHVWSLACFRHLKVLEMARYCPPSKQRAVAHPADHAIDRLSDKLSWYRGSNATRREWVEEALARVEEGHYHDQWVYLITAMEDPTG